jgi:hypothetical protein
MHATIETFAMPLLELPVKAGRRGRWQRLGFVKL